MDSHKGKEIGKVVEGCVIDWGIEDKLSCLTVDNASSNNVAVGYLKDNLSGKLVLDGLRDLHCLILVPKLLRSVIKVFYAWMYVQDGVPLSLR